MQHLHRGSGLTRRRRQAKSSSLSVKSPKSTTTPQSTTPQREAILAQELEPRTTTNTVSKNQKGDLSILVLFCSKPIHFTLKDHFYSIFRIH